MASRIPARSLAVASHVSAQGARLRGAQVRVFTKKTGAKPDFSEPVVLSADRGGTTVQHLCDQLHRSLAKEFKCAGRQKLLLETKHQNVTAWASMCPSACACWVGSRQIGTSWLYVGVNVPMIY